jgi:hypothetical protein
LDKSEYSIIYQVEKLVSICCILDKETPWSTKTISKNGWKTPLDDDERRVFERTEDCRALARLSKSLMSFKVPEYDVHVEYGRLRSARHSKA